MLLQSLKGVAGEFRENELVYLALTSKVEHPLRDRWAFALHEKLEKRNVYVAREWKRRVDLAIVEKNGDPLFLVELKAMYTFDAILGGGRSGKEMIKFLNEDMGKRKDLAIRGKTRILGVLLVTHPKEEISDELRGILKYWQGVNSAFTRLGSEVEIARVAKTEIEDFLGRDRIIKRGVLAGGSAFGIETDIFYWVIE